MVKKAKTETGANLCFEANFRPENADTIRRVRYSDIRADYVLDN